MTFKKFCDTIEELLVGVLTMKKGIHPNYHTIKVIMTDNSVFETRSTYGKDGDSLRLEVDPKSHAVWTGVRKLVDTAGQVSKFKNRYNIDL